MTISEWLEGDCNYNTGIKIYEVQKRHSKNLLRLMNKKHSYLNEAKLKYELKKLLPFEEKVNPQVDFTSLQINQPTQKQYRTLRLNELPVDLHETYIQQKNDFYRACSLKILMNDLPASSEAQALEYCLEIERLFDSIEKSWQVFDHYKQFKVVPELQAPKDFNNLTPAELIKSEKSKREAISKAKKAIAIWVKKLPEAKDVHARDKLTRQIQKKNEDLMGHEVALENIKKLIHKKPEK